MPTLFAVWLILLGAAHGKSLYPAERPLGDFLVKASEVSEDQPPETQKRIRANVRFVWDGMLESAYCHNDPVNKVDRLGLEESLSKSLVDPFDAGLFAFRGFGESNGMIPDLIQNTVVAPLVKKAELAGVIEGAVSDHLSGVEKCLSLSGHAFMNGAGPTSFGQQTSIHSDAAIRLFINSLQP